MDTAELLETTADRFESGVYGWTRLELENAEGYCSVGALSYTAIGRSAYDVDEVRKAAEAMIKVMNQGMAKVRDFYSRANLKHHQGNLDGLLARHAESIVVLWNDTEGVDKAMVIEAMKQAAKNLRNES